LLHTPTAITIKTINAGIAKIAEILSRGDSAISVISVL